MKSRSRSGRRFAWLAFFAAAGVGCASTAMAADLVKLQGGEVITDADLSHYLFRRTDLRSIARSKWGIESVLREMALARALAKEGELLQMPRPVGKESERFDDLYAQAVFTRLRPACVAPADAGAARKFYDENPRAFQAPTSVRLIRAMLPAQERVEGLLATDWLAKQARSIAAGQVSMDDVVAKADSVYRLEAQGDLGWVLLSEDNAVLRTLGDAREGDLVGPLREGDFVYLFSVVGKRESRLLAWEEVAVSAYARAVNYCRQTTTASLERDLLAKYGVEFDSAAIGALLKPAAANQR